MPPSAQPPCPGSGADSTRADPIRPWITSQRDLHCRGVVRVHGAPRDHHVPERCRQRPAPPDSLAGRVPHRNQLVHRDDLRVDPVTESARTFVSRNTEASSPSGARGPSAHPRRRSSAHEFWVSFSTTMCRTGRETATTRGVEPRGPAARNTASNVNRTFRWRRDPRLRRMRGGQLRRPCRVDPVDTRHLPSRQAVELRKRRVDRARTHP